MSEKYEVYSGYVVAKGNDPSDVLCVCITEEDADAIVDAMNTKDEVETLREKLQQVEKILGVGHAKRTATTQEAVKTDPPPARKKRTFKQKKCAVESCGKMFTPKSGSQTVCDECRAAGRKPTGLVKRVEGQLPGTGRRPSVEEVMDMPPDERKKWAELWSPAERNKAKMIEMRRIRNKGFSIDDPIMGVNAPSV